MYNFLKGDNEMKNIVTRQYLKPFSKDWFMFSYLGQALQMLAGLSIVSISMITSGFGA